MLHEETSEFLEYNAKHLIALKTFSLKILEYFNIVHNQALTYTLCTTNNPKYDFVLL